MSVRQVLLGHLSRKSAFSAAGTLAASILATYVAARPIRLHFVLTTFVAQSELTARSCDAIRGLQARFCPTSRRESPLTRHEHGALVSSSTKQVRTTRSYDLYAVRCRTSNTARAMRSSSCPCTRLANRCTAAAQFDASRTQHCTS